MSFKTPSSHPPNPKAASRPTRPRKKCGARSRGGALCRLDAGHGTNHVGYGQCKLHLGSTKRNTVKAAGEMAMEHLLVMGLPPESLDPMDAILACVRITAGEVTYCTNMVHELTPKQATVRHKKTVERNSDMESFTEVEKSSEVKLNIWIEARHSAMDRLVKFSKAAIDCGISERQVQVAEGLGQQLGTVLQAVLNELNLSAEQKLMAPDVVRKNLMLLEAAHEDKVSV